MTRKFEKDRCYFLVGYLDVKLKLPFIETYVFVGIEKVGDGSQRWLFQDVRSFFRVGERLVKDEEDQIDVLSLDQSGLDTILDSAGLAEEFERLRI